MWDLKDLEELEAKRREHIEDEFYERACTLFYMAVSALFAVVMTLFVLSLTGHLK